MSSAQYDALRTQCAPTGGVLAVTCPADASSWANAIGTLDSTVPGLVIAGGAAAVIGTIVFAVVTHREEVAPAAALYVDPANGSVGVVGRF